MLGKSTVEITMSSAEDVIIQIFSGFMPRATYQVSLYRPSSFLEKVAWASIVVKFTWSCVAAFTFSVLLLVSGGGGWPPDYEWDEVEVKGEKRMMSRCPIRNFLGNIQGLRWAGLQCHVRFLWDWLIIVGLCLAYVAFIERSFPQYIAVFGGTISLLVRIMWALPMHYPRYTQDIIMEFL